MPRLLLLTACRNEAEYIGRCIDSVCRQTQRPTRWIINDDGSTDGTASIVQELAAKVDFIEFRSVQRDGGRSFGSQYRALRAAYESEAHNGYEFVSFLDGDSMFQDESYFAELLGEFERAPDLGVAGGYLIEPGRRGLEVSAANAPWTVAGGVQTFRRSVFDAIGGYVPLELGGSDMLAEIRVRMLGYRSISFPHLLAVHHRPPSSAGGRLRGLFKGGRMDAAFGYHWLYSVLKFLRRLGEAPLLTGSFARLAGYAYQRLCAQPPIVPPDVARFLQAEQIARLRDCWGALRKFRPGLRDRGYDALTR